MSPKVQSQILTAHALQRVFCVKKTAFPYFISEKCIHFMRWLIRMNLCINVQLVETSSDETPLK